MESPPLRVRKEGTKRTRSFKLDGVNNKPNLAPDKKGNRSPRRNGQLPKLKASSTVPAIRASGVDGLPLSKSAPTRLRMSVSGKPTPAKLRPLTSGAGNPGGESDSSTKMRRHEIAFQAIESKSYRKTRTMKWMAVLYLGGRIHKMKKDFKDLYELMPTRIAKHDASKKFQKTYRTHLLHRVIPQVSYLCTDGWQFMMGMRIFRKRIHARLLESFIASSIRHQRARKAVSIFKKLRFKIVLTQRCTRSYFKCKEARLRVLTRYWNKTERRMQANRLKSTVNLHNLSHQSHLGLGRLDEQLARRQHKVTQQQTNATSARAKRATKLLRDVVNKRKQAENLVYNGIKKKMIKEYLFETRATHADKAWLAMQDKINSLHNQQKRKSLAPHDIESMRKMMQSGETTDKFAIAEYLAKHSKGHSAIANEVYKEWPPFLMLKDTPLDKMMGMIENAQEQCRQLDKSETVSLSSKLMNNKLTDSKEMRGFNNLVGMAMLNKLTDKAANVTAPAQITDRVEVA